MASKLTSSLRKSISAEKQSVEDKQTGTVDNTIVEPKVAVEKPPAAKLAAPRKAAPRKVAPRKVAAKTLSTATKSVVENVKAAVSPESPAVEKPKANTAANSAKQSNVDAVKSILDKINSSSLELSNSFVENFMGINQDFNSYLQQISDVSNLVKVKEANEKFLDNLRKRQQELIKKNMELLSSFKLV